MSELFKYGSAGDWLGNHWFYPAPNPIWIIRKDPRGIQYHLTRRVGAKAKISAGLFVQKRL